MTRVDPERRAGSLVASHTVVVLVDFINPLDFDGADALAPSALAAAERRGQG